MHRIGPDLGGVRVSTALQIAKLFHANPDWTGSNIMPYTFVICPSGLIEQALDLRVISPHAWHRNTDTLGIAVIGDHRKEQPPSPQVDALVAICCAFVDWLGSSVQDVVFGHDELPEGSSDKTKECPGRNLPMHVVRLEVHELLRSRGHKTLIQAGVTL